MTRRTLFASLLSLAIKTPVINRLPIVRTRWEAINKEVADHFLRSAALAFKHHDYSAEFGKPGNKIGDTINIRRPARFQ